jgi:hypothetical protein
VQVTITNQGTLSAVAGLMVAVDAAGTANGFGLSGSTCSDTIAAGASCTVNVTFVPAAAGALTGTLVVSSTNGGSPVDLELAGIGFDFQLAVAGSSSATVVQGQEAYYTLQLTTLGGSTGAAGGKFSFQCGTLPANSVCTFNPTQLTVPGNGVNGDVVLGITTGASTPTSEKNSDKQSGRVLLGGLLMLPLILRRRKLPLDRLLLVVVMLVGLVGGLSSCVVAGGSNAQLQLGGGTPPGSYPVTVSASANGVVHSTTVTLMVN